MYIVREGRTPLTEAQDCPATENENESRAVLVYDMMVVGIGTLPAHLDADVVPLIAIAR